MALLLCVVFCVCVGVVSGNQMWGWIAFLGVLTITNLFLNATDKIVKAIHEAQRRDSRERAGLRG